MPSGLEGVADLTRKLELLKRAARGSALRSVVRAGMAPVLKRAQELIPQGNRPHYTYRKRLVAPGFASRNLLVITTLSAGAEGASAILGVRREAFYAVQFVERRLGKSKDKGRAWLAPALAQTQAEQLSAIGAQLRKRIEAAAAGGLLPE